MKMSEMIAIPKNKYPSVMKYTTPIKPLFRREVPGMRTQLNHHELSEYSNLPVAKQIIVVLLDKSVLVLNVVVFHICFIIPSV
jgi:hypothetical protein